MSESAVGVRAHRARRLLWQVPLAVGLAAASTALVLVEEQPAPVIAPLLLLAVLTPELVRVDVAEHRLPNSLTLSAILTALAAALVTALVTGEPPATALIAGLGYGAFLLVLAVTGGMGMGDVKLGLALGLASATGSIAVLSPVLAFVLGGVAAVITTARRGRGERIAFGPFLLAGFWVAVALELAVLR